MTFLSYMGATLRMPGLLLPFLRGRRASAWVGGGGGVP
jgi:hypothetical protein